MLPERKKDYNLTKDEYLAIYILENERIFIIKPADKESSIVVWDRLDYLAEAETQLSDSNIYKEIKLSGKDQIKLVEKRNSMFEGLKKKTVITEKEKNYFKFNFIKATNVDMLYLLLNIHKRLSNVPERPVILNYGTPSENFSEFLDHHLQPVMKGSKSYKKGTADFLNKLKDLGQIPEGSIIITAGMVGLYPSIPHTEGLEVLRKQYGKFLHKKVPTKDIIKMADALKKGFNSNFFNKYLELLLVLKHDTQQNEIENRIPLVVSYNPVFRNLSATLWKICIIRYSDAEFRTVFTPNPFTAYRSTRKLKSFLVRSKSLH